MVKNPRISVVVPAYNEEKRIGKCLESLKKQTIVEPYEIIVCDNNSTDKTASITHKLGVKVVNEKKKGYVYAAKRGVDTAVGEYIALTDADTEVPKDWLKKIVQTYDSYPEIVGIGGPFTFRDGSILINTLIRIINFINPNILTLSLCGMNMSFRKNAYKKVGGYDTTISLQADTLLGNKLRDCGKITMLRNNTVSSSGRRFHSTGYALYEIFTRFINVIWLLLFKKTLFRFQQDIR